MSTVANRHARWTTGRYSAAGRPNRESGDLVSQGSYLGGSPNIESDPPNRSQGARCRPNRFRNHRLRTASHGRRGVQPRRPLRPDPRAAIVTVRRPPDIIPKPTGRTMARDGFEGSGLKRSAVLWWALGGAFLLATLVHPRRWLDDGLGSAVRETVVLVAVGALMGALVALLRSWLARRRDARSAEGAGDRGRRPAPRGRRRS
jgi:hypothetical protein